MWPAVLRSCATGERPASACACHHRAHRCRGASNCSERAWPYDAPRIARPCCLDALPNRVTGSQARSALEKPAVLLSVPVCGCLCALSAPARIRVLNPAPACCKRRSPLWTRRRGCASIPYHSASFSGCRGGCAAMWRRASRRRVRAIECLSHSAGAVPSPPAACCPARTARCNACHWLANLWMCA